MNLPVNASCFHDMVCIHMNKSQIKGILSMEKSIIDQIYGQMQPSKIVYYDKVYMSESSNLESILPARIANRDMKAQRIQMYTKLPLPQFHSFI